MQREPANFINKFVKTKIHTQPQDEMQTAASTSGIAVGGGKSTRMGLDKGLIIYHEKAQIYHVCDMLVPYCQNVFISSNPTQQFQIDNGYNILPDLPEFANTGPIAALLTAFKHLPDTDLLVIGCDYPLFDASVLNHFLTMVRRDSLAHAFYNGQEKYEPLLAWYSRDCAPILKGRFDNGEYSLQQFLRSNHAEKYRPENQKVMTSVNTPEQYEEVKAILKNQMTANK